MIGNIIADRYEIIKSLGNGGMASVWVATDSRFDREVAIKVLHDSLNNDQMRDKFYKEAQIVAQLEHDAIVPIYDFGETAEGQPFLVMRMMRGGTLREKLEKAGGQIRLDEIETIMKRICAALDKVHANNIIHRDLKLANILLDETGMAYLADFGVARIIEGTQTTSIAGTPYYMAPEQIRGQSLSPQTDIYQLGIMLFFLLTGRFPYTGDSSMGIMRKHIEDPIPSPLEINPELLPRYEKLLSIALAKKPEDRQASAGEFLTQFSQRITPRNTTSKTGSQSTTPKPSHKPPPPLTSSNPSITPLAGGEQVPWYVDTLSDQRTRYILGGGAVILLFLIIWGGNIFTSGSQNDLDLEITPTTAVANQDNTPEVVQVVATNTATPLPPSPEPSPSPSPTIPPTETPNVIDLGPETIVLGYSANNNILEAVRLGAGEKTIIFVGGLHAGFAPSSVELIRLARNHLEANPELVPENVTLYMIESMNPDSSEYEPESLAGRLNGNGVDLNRNWDCDWVANASWRNFTVSGGSSPFSEPEVQALQTFIFETSADAVIFWEARVTNGLVSPGGCQQVSLHGIPLARKYADATGYGVSDFANISSYDVNGDVNNWLDSQGVSAITILLPSYTDPDWQVNKAAIESILQYVGDS